ncbi:carboxypeptidase-like regulatory domain-containing protein, partial [Roseisolibacter sp. H3M3-2]|uniref:carboxypeptidase-like regulatory domain-containing protein n=1 Tax=Roseisolibacter sp. H3M3-2 TaxID=3031323 RepID=UPI0023DCAB54
AAALGEDDGAATLVAPAAGRYRVRVDRTGYAAWLAPAPVTLDPSRSDVLAVAAALGERRDRLDAVVVRSDAPCGRERADASTTTAAATALWDEAGKALLATALVERAGRLPLRVRTVERTLTTAGAVVRERALPAKVVTGRPFVTLPAESLNAGGWVRQGDEGLDFFAPDASVLLSPLFAASHCFRAVRAAEGQDGLVGLAFEPVAQSRPRPDVRGTLWLDGASAELRHVDFEFVNVPAPDGGGPMTVPRNAAPGGRAEFARTASGAWIVRRWHIRLPVLTRWRSNIGAESPIGLTPTRRATYGVAELLERAGEATPLGESPDDRPAAVVAGVAFDSVAGAPLVGAEVTVGGSHRARSDDAGRFRVPLWMPGEYEVRVRHPRLVAAGMGVVGTTLPLASGDSLTLAAAVPGAETLRAARCGPRADAVLLGGAVVAADGTPA